MPAEPSKSVLDVRDLVALDDAFRERQERDAVERDRQIELGEFQTERERKT